MEQGAGGRERNATDAERFPSVLLTPCLMPHASVSRHGRIDRFSPAIDTAPHAADVTESLFEQPVGDQQTSSSRVAINDDRPMPVRFEFLTSLDQFTHRDPHRAVNRASFNFNFFAAIQQQQIATFVNVTFGLGAVDFEVFAHRAFKILKKPPPAIRERFGGLANCLLRPGITTT